MIRTALFAAAALSALSVAVPANAHGVHVHRHYHVVPVPVRPPYHYHVAPSYKVHPAPRRGIYYGGSASVNRSCTSGAGCTREWNRTRANGTSASGSATVKPGSGVTRSGTGFYGRTW
ncbi:MAG: hypothetical protein AAGL24_28360 [Pseudomonadota bacterium]